MIEYIDPLLQRFNDVRPKVDKLEVVNDNIFWMNISVKIWDEDREFIVKARVDSVDGATMCRITSSPVEDREVDLAVNACAARLAREENILLHY